MKLELESDLRWILFMILAKGFGKNPDGKNPYEIYCGMTKQGLVKGYKLCIFVFFKTLTYSDY